MKKTVLQFTVLFLLLLPLASQSTGSSVKNLPQSAMVISPVSGTWANFQSLVLSVPEGCNVFYSFTGSDPLQSGFAYDDSVLIEKAGEVVLRIATVAADNSATEQVIKYTVNQKPLDAPFYTKTQREPLFNVSSEIGLDIPTEMKYCIGDNETPYISGRKLTIDSKNGLSRIVPVIIQNNNDLYRVMVKIVPSDNEGSLPIESVQSVFPFTVVCKDWNNFEFDLPEEYMVSIDNATWKSGKFSEYVDRSFSHTIAWKTTKELEGLSVNPSGVVILPEKPEILRVSRTGSINAPLDLYISDPRYSFTTVQQDKKVLLYSKCGIDTLFGDDMAGTLNFLVYFGNIYQGSLPITVALDKQPPYVPVFESDQDDSYARKPVNLNLISNADIYFKITTPTVSDFGFYDVSKLPLETASNDNSEFTKFTGKNVILPGSETGAVFYQIEAYAMDFSGNKSDVSRFTKIVDRHNYYVTSVNKASSDELQDGSPERPFSSLKQIIPVLASSDFIRIHLEGSFYETESLDIKTNCEIIGTGETRIEFLENATISIDGATLSISNCIIEQNNSGKSYAEIDSRQVDPEAMYQHNLFQVKNGGLFLSGSEIIAIMGINGAVINVQNSSLQILDTRITAQATQYAALISGINCYLDLNKANLISIGATAVSFTINLGSADVRNSSCTVIADMGRIGEFSRLEYSLVDNTFVYQKSFEQSIKNETLTENEAIWSDSRSKQLDYSGNTIMGFKVAEK